MPCNVLEEIRANNPHNIVACKEQMLLRWMNSDSLTTPSCWWSLVKAIKGIGNNLIARKIEIDNGEFFAMCIYVHAVPMYIYMSTSSYTVTVYR